MIGPSSVLLAGGGSAGHISPLLAIADALRRRWPRRRDHRARHGRAAWRRGWSRRGLPARADPAGAAAAPARTSTCCASRAALRAAVRRRRDGARPGPARRGRRLRRLRLDARLPRGPPARLPLVVHEGNALPGLANRLGARFTPYVATSFPGTGLPHARLHRPADAPDDQPPSTATRCGPRRARTSASTPDRPTLLVTGGSQGAAPAQRSRSAASVAALAAAGVQVLHVVGPQGLRCAPCDARVRTEPPYVVRASTCDRMDLGLRRRRRRRCAGPGANTVTRGLRRVGLPGGLRAAADRQRRAARSTPRRWSTPAAGCWSPTQRCTPEWVRGRRCPACSPTRRGSRRCGRPLRRLIPLDADEKLADLIAAAGQRTGVAA